MEKDPTNFYPVDEEKEKLEKLSYEIKLKSSPYSYGTTV